MGYILHILHADIFMLQQMHEVQTFATDVPVCHAAPLGLGVGKWLNGLRCCLG